MNAEMMNEHWFDPDATTFGDRLAGAREQAGLSQPDLARRLGVKLKTIQAWEEDLSEPRANKLSMMAGFLNVSLSWLISGEGQGLQAPDDAGEVSPDVNEILQEMRDIRTQMTRSSERLGRLEKALRAQMREDMNS